MALLMQHWVCLQAEQALDAELASNVQADGASPMEEDVLPEAACPEILSTDDQANVTVTVVSETSTKAGLKRKQRDSSTHKLPRCVLDGLWPAGQQDCFAASALASFESADIMQGPNCLAQPQNSLKLLPDCIHSHFVVMIRDTCMCAGQEENLSNGKLGSQMEHERLWSFVVNGVLVDQASQLPLYDFFLCCSL